MNTPAKTIYPLRGFVVAVVVMSSWFGFVVAGVLEIHPLAGTWWGDLMWALATTWLFIGLFITAHEAMHGLVLPTHRQRNDWVGRLALFLYAGLSYDRLLAGHIEHHRAPSTEDDPDYWPTNFVGVVGWYIRFLLHYISWVPIFVVATEYTILDRIINIDATRLWMMWLAPQIFSSFQLFYFGTYLPHRPDQPYQGSGSTKTRSSYYPTWLSLLTCYHFGYHYEHHAYPYVPWWKLPDAVGTQDPQSMSIPRSLS